MPMQTNVEQNVDASSLKRVTDSKMTTMIARDPMSAQVRVVNASNVKPAEMNFVRENDARSAPVSKVVPDPLRREPGAFV